MGAIELFNILKNHHSIEYLFIGENKLDDRCISSLIEFIKTCKSIKNIYLDENRFADFGIINLSTALTGNNKICELSLQGNWAITDKSTNALKNMLIKSNIRMFLVGWTSLTSPRVLEAIPKIRNSLLNKEQKFDFSGMYVNIFKLVCLNT